MRIEQGISGVVVLPVAKPSPSQSVKARGLSEIEFDEQMDARKPGLASAIRNFVASVEAFGVYPELRGALNLKAEVGSEKPVNLGYITKNGQFWTDAAGWKMPPAAIMNYLSALATLIGGSVVKPSNSPYLAGKGKSAPKIEELLPQHAEGWKIAIEELLRQLREASAE